MAESGVYLTVDDIKTLIKAMNDNPQFMEALKAQAEAAKDPRAGNIAPLGPCGIIFCGG